MAMRTFALLALLGGAASAQVEVHNVDELYAATNAPASAGETIVVAAGIYPLDSTLDSRGPIRLQTGTSLIGSGDATIDGRNIRPLGTGVIRIGVANTVAGLTILAPSIV